MVSYAFQPEYAPSKLSNEPENLSTTIKLSEILNAGARLEASAFSIESHNAVTALESSGLPLISLYGEEGLCKGGYYPHRFKRNYVSSDKGIPFLSSSEIISLRPTTKKFVSRRYTPKLERLLPEKWDVLISRSGTIGNIGLATESILGKALSEHVIRLQADSSDIAGYVAAFLRSRYGRPQLMQGIFGSVINQIEPQHLERVSIPELPPIRQIAIGRLMCEAGELRDEANSFLDEADRLLHKRLDLPYLSAISPSDKTAVIAKVKASQLMGRLEGSFHDAVAILIEKRLSKLPVKVTTVGDLRVTKEVRAVTKFRKRIYVKKSSIPLLNSKQLFQVSPVGLKFLARGAHIKDLPEISLQEEMIAVTCSGTIGRVQIIPKYMEGWASSQDSIRVVASESMNSGYLYAWLASDYGECLIKRQTYGSVVVHIDREMLASIPIPLAETKIADEIGDLVLTANRLRDQAWSNEQEAISKLESLIANKSVVPAQNESSPNQIPLKDIQYDPNAIPIWQLAAQLSAKVPDEEWVKVPSDLSQRFDYYQGLKDN